MNLRIDALSKRYKSGVLGLNDFSLSIKPGVLGLLGPNGAGKSTLMRILATITRPSSGSVHWCGKDIQKSRNELRETLGYLPQDFGIYPNLTASEFLDYIAAAKGIDARRARRRTGELLEMLNLTEAANRPLGSFSGGMKQRVGIAQALLNDPRLLIVDEPTGGLDPEERLRFRNILSELPGERIVILSTHIVSDVEAAASEIAIIRHGSLLTSMPPDLLLKTVEGKVFDWVSPASEVPDLKKRYQITSTMRRSDGIRVRALMESNPPPFARPVPPTLEDAYLSLIGTQTTPE